MPESLQQNNGIGEREIVVTRTVSAPRDLVFEAWTTPHHMLHWWGPSGWANADCEIDLRIGGAWHIVMIGPGGQRFGCGGEYREIEAPHRLVFTNNAEDAEGRPLLQGLTTVSLSEEDAGTTKVEVRMLARGLYDFTSRMLDGMEPGWRQSLERLALFFMPATPDRTIVGNRILRAPRSFVFEAFSAPEHLARWWGPNGFTTTTHYMDFRPGGSWRHTMHGPDGRDYENEVVYLEVVRPERIVYDHISGPFHRNTITFDATGTRETRLTFSMLFPTSADRDRVAREYGADTGLEQTLDRLVEDVNAQAKDSAEYS